MRQLLTDLRGNPIYSFAQRRLRRIRYQHHSPTLTVLVQNRAWDDVLRRLHRFPNEALHRDELTGNTLLHLACRLDPPVAVIRAFKAASRIKNHEGATPLHVAASHRCSAESLTVLIECASQQKPDGEDKESSSKGVVSPTADLSRMGRAPIHYACVSHRGLDLKAFQVLFEVSLREGNLSISPEKGLGLDDFVDDDLLDDDLYQATESGTDVLLNVLGLKDATGHTPLALLFRRYRERVKVVIRTVDRLHRQHKENANKAALAAAMTVHADLGGLWERAGWIVARLSEERLKREGLLEQAEQIKECQSPGELAVGREAASWARERLGSSPVDLMLVKNIRASIANISSDDEISRKAKTTRRRFRILHASVGLAGYGCPPEMVRLAISLHPHQVREMDEDGNLPIHIAATASSFFTDAEETTPLSMAAAAVAAADISDDLSVISDAMSFFSSATVSQTTNPFDKVIKLLLQYYPEAARIPQGQTGRLPLVSAIESGFRTWNDGLSTLLEAYPPALHSKKLIHNSLYANILEKVASDCSPGNVTFDGRCPTSTTREMYRRQQCAARTTLFDLLRTKPDWMEHSL